MSLNVLEGVDSGTARGALASTVISITGAGLHVVPEQFASLSQALVIEAREALRLSTEDDSPRALNAIRIFLSKEVDRRLYEGVNRKALRAELGTSGQLPITGYSISFSGGFDEGHKEDRRFIERAIRTADRVQHIEAGIVSGLKLPRGASLFAKLVKSSDKKRTQILLVDALRIETGLDVMRAWRIFPETVNVNLAVSPLELLKAFVEVYGFDVEYVGFEKSKLITSLALPAEFTNEEDVEAIKIIHNGKRDVIGAEMGASASKMEDDSKVTQETFILLSYAVDIKRYKKDYAAYG